MDSGLKGRGMNPPPKQEKVKDHFASSWLLALEPLRSVGVFNELMQITWQKYPWAATVSFEHGIDQKC